MPAHLNITARHPLMHMPFWTLGYFGIIVLANMMLVWFEPIFLAGSAIPPAIFASGFVFVLRDFAQREIGHFVLGAILAAAGATFWLAGPEVALASSSAFLIAELADWIIYSVTKRPMSERVLISSLVSVPLDTAVFYALLGILDPLALAFGIAIKLVGTMVFWIVLKAEEIIREPSASTVPVASALRAGSSVGPVELPFLRNPDWQYGILSVERDGTVYRVTVLCTGEDDSIALSSFAQNLGPAHDDAEGGL